MVIHLKLLLQRFEIRTLTIINMLVQMSKCYKVLCYKLDRFELVNLVNLRKAKNGKHDNPVVILGFKLGLIDLNLLVPSGIITTFKIS